MEFGLLTVALLTVLYGGGLLFNWNSGSDTQRFMGCVATLILLACTIMAAVLVGQSHVPANAEDSVAGPLRTGHEYELLFDAQDGDNFVVMVQDTNGAYRTLRVKVLPPAHFVVVSNDRVVELK